jgi:very-short-patch-repair endonuclease
VRADSGALVTVPDFAWPERRVAVYCDGCQFHGDRDTLELDASKRNFLASRGWTVLTYWGRQILAPPDRCAEQVAKVVGAGAPDSYVSRAEAVREEGDGDGPKPSI